jgi:hypothetical protein
VPPAWTSMHVLLTFRPSFFCSCSHPDEERRYELGPWKGLARLIRYSAGALLTGPAGVENMLRQRAIYRVSALSSRHPCRLPCFLRSNVGCCCDRARRPCLWLRLRGTRKNVSALTQHPQHPSSLPSSPAAGINGR